MASRDSKASAFSAKRLLRELEAINSAEDVTFSAGLVDDGNPFEWVVTIEGPPNTIYDGFHFQATLHFPQDYPMRPPKMTFQTRMYHPNIFKNGDVCISILNPPPSHPVSNDLGGHWKPTLGAKEVILSVVSLLTDPNHDSPANSEASREYQHDFVSYKRRVQQYLEE